MISFVLSLQRQIVRASNKEVCRDYSAATGGSDGQSEAVRSVHAEDLLSTLECFIRSCRPCG